MTGAFIIATLSVALLAGCARAARDARPATPPPTTSAVSGNTVTATNFDRLWRACQDVARERLFTIERQDYRAGVLTTAPMISAQFFEPWRRDALTSDAVTESSLASIRRRIRFQFTRHDDDDDDDGRTFSVIPHVDVERYSSAERRLTSAMMYRSAFRKTTATGTRESDRGVHLPARYWYRIGGDPVLEADLAESIRARL